MPSTAAAAPTTRRSRGGVWWRAARRARRRETVRTQSAGYAARRTAACLQSSVQPADALSLLMARAHGADEPDGRAGSGEPHLHRRRYSGTSSLSNAASADGVHRNSSGKARRSLCRACDGRWLHRMNASENMPANTGAGGRSQREERRSSAGLFSSMDTQWRLLASDTSANALWYLRRACNDNIGSAAAAAAARCAPSAGDRAAPHGPRRVRQRLARPHEARQGRIHETRDVAGLDGVDARRAAQPYQSLGPGRLRVIVRCSGQRVLH